MSQKMPRVVKNLFFENGSYKLVAFCVSLVLWITIMGRKDSVINQDINLQFLMAENHKIVNKVPENVSVKLSGPMLSIKKFTQSGEFITLDLSELKPGRRIIKINNLGINLPVGVKVLNIDPKQIEVYIKEVKTGAAEDAQ